MREVWKAAWVWINKYYNFQPGQPGGGVKQSGFGRENCLETLNSYTVTKAVVINLEEAPVSDGFDVTAPNAE